MDRKTYLELCREAALIEGGVENIKDVPDRLRVRFAGYEYHPEAYLLGFERDGTVRHTAILHEIGANAVVYAPLGKVEKKT